MSAIKLLWASLCLSTLLLGSATANQVFIDKWGEEYCRQSYCALMDKDVHENCCIRFKTCCAYIHNIRIGVQDPFYFELEKPITIKTPPPVTTIAPENSHTELPEVEDVTLDLGGPIEIVTGSPPGVPARLQAGRPSDLRIPSMDQVKPVTLEDDGRPRKPVKPSRNDVTYHLPALHPEIEKIRTEEHQRESCRAKFCGVMGVSQWYTCCSRYKNCCAYVTYHSYQGNPFIVSNPFDFE